MQVEQFIEQGKDQGWLHETRHVNRVFIGGKSVDCPVYEVRVDHLRYNEQNGRIATFMSRYRDEHGSLPEDFEGFNDAIEQMITADNPKRLAATKLSIKAKGQEEVAIILSDGIVVDGNRRLTCLRQLSREEGEQKFLRCHIFSDNYDKNAIKGLELEIQLGKDEKVNYNAIDRLVDIYRWVNDEGMSKEEYARHANMKMSEMKKALDQIDVMNDFLEYIDAPGAFYIAQDMKLQGPFESLATYLPKCKGAEEREEMKQVVFANCLMHNLGDSTRSSRDLCQNILDSQARDSAFVSEQLDLAERVFEKFEDIPDGAKVTIEFIRDEVADDIDLKVEQKASRDKERLKAGNRKIKNLQVRGIQDALDSLEGIEPQLFSKLAPEQLSDMEEGIQGILVRASVIQAKLEELRAN